MCDLQGKGKWKVEFSLCDAQKFSSEELLQEYLKITPMEAESMVVAKEVPPDPGDCKVMEPKLSPMLPPKVEIEYFSPHARPYGYRILPLVERDKRYEYYKEVLSFSRHETFAREWSRFIRNLPESRKVAARLPDIKNYRFINCTTRYIESPPRDVRRKLKDKSIVKEGGIHQPVPQVFYHIPATGWQTKPKEKPKPKPTRGETAKKVPQKLHEIEFVAIKPKSKAKFCAEVLKHL